MDDDLKPLFNKLTRLQKGICLGLLNGKTYAEAYRDAGGIASTNENANSIVSRMLSTEVNVIAFMGAAEGKAVTSAVATKEQVLTRLSQLALGNIADLVEFGTAQVPDADGNLVTQTYWHLKDQSELSEEQLAMISELSAGKDGFKFKTHSQTQAAKQLADMLGWNAPHKVANTDTEGNEQPGLMEMARTIVFALESAMGNQDSETKAQEGDNDE